MKKLLSLLLAMAMVLSMTACTSAPAETTTTPAETTSAPIAGVPFTVIVTDVRRKFPPSPGKYRRRKR